MMPSPPSVWIGNDHDWLDLIEAARRHCPGKRRVMWMACPCTMHRHMRNAERLEALAHAATRRQAIIRSEWEVPNVSAS